MKPMEALCLECLKHWWWVVEQKRGSCGEIDSEGRVWTRVSATEVAAWILERFGCEVTPRQCQNALSRLAQRDLVIREKRWKHAHCQAYSYASSDQQRSIDDSQSTTRSTQTDSSEGPPSVNQIYLSPSQSTEKISAAVSVKDGGASTVGALRAPPPAPPVKEKVGELEYAPQRRSLKAMVELCQAIGRGDVPNPAESPHAYVKKSEEKS